MSGIVVGVDIPASPSEVSSLHEKGTRAIGGLRPASAEAQQRLGQKYLRATVTRIAATSAPMTATSLDVSRR